MGQSPPSVTYNHAGVGLPFFQGKAEFGNLYPEARVWCTQPNKIALADDILLSVRAPVGPTNLAPYKCCIGRGLAAIRPENSLSLSYMLYILRRYADELDTKGTGTTFKAVSGKVVREFPIPLAPLPEQHRIVAKLDELFSELDAGVAALERAQAKLKRYRASVLKAAVEGRLTEEWRRKNPPDETGAELLQRILVERRQLWEEEQLAKFAASDRKPPRNWRDKYKEPLGPDEGELPELPQGWCWATVDQVSNISSGQTPKGAAANVTPTGEVPWYKVGDMNLPGNERAMQHSRAYLSMNKAKALGLRVFPAGTIVFPKRGGAIATNKKRELAVSSCLDLNIMAMSPVGDVGTWLWWWFQSVDLAVLADGSNVPQINNQDILTLLLPLPPASEQKIVLDLVQELMDVWQRSLEAVKSRRTTSARLRQSILKLAFAGHLVPQDPTDEPASVILERIRADQEGNRRKRRPARPIHKRKKQVL